MHVYRPDEEILKDFQTLRCSELQCLFCSVGEAGKGCGSPLSRTTSGQPGKKLGDVLNPPEIQFSSKSLISKPENARRDCGGHLGGG